MLVLVRREWDIRVEPAVVAVVVRLGNASSATKLGIGRKVIRRRSHHSYTILTATRPYI
jgi:hypothetical protein